VRITFVGTGDAFNSAGRNHSCYLIESTGCPPVMIDFGATALAALRQRGREPTEISAFVITHLHGDHIGGFPFLFIDAMYNMRRATPLLIVGPAGIKERVMEFLRIAYGRVANEPVPGGVEIREILPGESADIFGYQVRAFAAAHMDPPEQPLCLRITDGAGTIAAFSGDTELCPGLYEAAAGADVLIAECTQMKPPSGRHITWQHWEEAHPRSGAKRLILSHLGADVREASKSLAEKYPVEFADDGWVVEI
jgi:ribonuclease BN (tRNA processing enzyme)